MRVQPIREIDKFLEMQRRMLEDGKTLELLLLQTMFNTNLRVSDALMLKWDDVLDPDPETPDGTFRRDFWISEKKTKKDKWIPMTEQLRNSLAEFYKRYKPAKRHYIFRSNSNRIAHRNVAWCRQYVTLIFKKYAKLVGIKTNIGSHTPRKTWGYHAYKNGVDIYEIMRILNHSQVRDTEIYCGIDDDRIRERYNMVSQLTSDATGLLTADKLGDRYVPTKKKLTKKRKKKK